MRNGFFFLLILIAQSAFAQYGERVTYLDEHGKLVKEKKAIVLLQRVKMNDTLWEFNYYELNGPRFVFLQAKDEEGNIRNGYYETFRNGVLDSTLYFENDILHNKSGIGSSSSRRQIPKADSLNGNIFFQPADSAGKPILRIANTDKDACFPGGDQGWKEYLMHHLKYPQRAYKNRTQGAVVILFIVDKNGKIQDPWISRSIEYSLDQEALRIIKSSPQWVPAFQGGKNLKSYKKQEIKFSLSR